MSKKVNQKTTQKSNLTTYHAKYFAYEITRLLPSNDINKFTASLQDAKVDLNPHQVEAALFAFASPLSQGALLADEVGLGKTIEAGIILLQQWSENKRKLLIICPANLRKQWNQELLDKFYLPSVILENKSFKQALKNNKNPFNQDNEKNPAIVICSYQFAKSQKEYLEQTKWDLVVMDEAHRLRNVYKPSNKISNAIKTVLRGKKKILLTATPLQNSILELYGLVSIIDEHTFGDLKSFKSQYNHVLSPDEHEHLRKRLEPICRRTLRKNVLEYINYTQRKAIREDFYPHKDEQQLYEWVSEYLQKTQSYAIANSQRHLMTLVLRKLLASSSFAIGATLEGFVTRLEKMIAFTQTTPNPSLQGGELLTPLLQKEGSGVVSNEILEDLTQDYEGFEQTKDEWTQTENQTENNAEIIFEIISETTTENTPNEDLEDFEQELLSKEDVEGIKAEILELKKFRDLAKSISKNAKADKLFLALTKAFEQLETQKANPKALIFTESRRTQEFLYKTLEENGYKGKVVRFNGTNNDKESTEIYKKWLTKHKGTDKITGSPTADQRAALVEHFKNEATIMVATEAAAEGINLQFCSLVVNYDLPWNPQRIEQRIGRCHRYGQKFDVVVVNFLNLSNKADKRVYELLDKKLELFSGVFGASDEILGTMDNGLDFEKKIANIYNTCRTEAQIKIAFDDLQQRMEQNIKTEMTKTHTILLENFDPRVRDTLKDNFDKSKIYLNKFEEKLWKITQFFLQNNATFDNEDYTFSLTKNPFATKEIHAGPYMILKQKEGQKKTDIIVPDDTNVYRINHPLAQEILTQCKETNTPTRKITFKYNPKEKISFLEKLKGQTGWLQIDLLQISSFDTEQHLLLACISDEGEQINTEDIPRFFSLAATENELVHIPQNVMESCQNIITTEKEKHIIGNKDRNTEVFEIEMEKLDQWADDMKISLEKELKDIDTDIKVKNLEAKKLSLLEEKLKLKRLINELEKKRAEKRQNLFSAQDEIATEKDKLFDTTQAKLQQNITQKNIFAIQWEVV